MLFLENNGWNILLLLEKSKFFFGKRANYAAAGFEPGPAAWQTGALPLYQQPNLQIIVDNCCFKIQSKILQNLANNCKILQYNF